jgi:small subunit ribosomal protein S6
LVKVKGIFPLARRFDKRKRIDIMDKGFILQHLGAVHFSLPAPGEAPGPYVHREETLVRTYEVAYILDPDLPEENLNRFEEVARSQGAEILSTDRWEKRKLAYEIRKKSEGYYFFMNLKAEPKAVAELERVFKITEGVLRHLILRKEE